MARSFLARPRPQPPIASASSVSLTRTTTTSQVDCPGVSEADLGRHRGPQAVCQTRSRRALCLQHRRHPTSRRLSTSANPERTLFVVASKTFMSQGIITNTHSARAWFLDHAKDRTQHFVAISTNVAAATEFGIALENMFHFWVVGTACGVPSVALSPSSSDTTTLSNSSRYGQAL